MPVSLAAESYYPLLAGQFPIVVVGAVDTSGTYAPYSQGLAAELTVSAACKVFVQTNKGAHLNRQEHPLGPFQ